MRFPSSARRVLGPSAVVTVCPEDLLFCDRGYALLAAVPRSTAKSALALRTILGPIRLELVASDMGRPFDRAFTTLDALALTEAPPRGCGGRFEFFAKVDAGALGASHASLGARYSRRFGCGNSCGRARVRARLI